MKIGLISDVHSSPVPLQQAIALFSQESVDKIICAGDIAGYHEELEETVKLLIDNNVDCIIGNHDQTYLQSNTHNHKTTAFQYLENLPKTLTFNIEEKRIYIVHAHPPSEQHGGIKLLDEGSKLIEERKTFWSDTLANLNADVLIVGHTHQVFAEQLGKVLTINPGSTVFNHSCMILQIPELTVQIHALENKELLKVWNWGMYIRYQ